MNNDVDIENGIKECDVCFEQNKTSDYTHCENEKCTFIMCQTCKQKCTKCPQCQILLDVEPYTPPSENTVVQLNPNIGTYELSEILIGNESGGDVIEIQWYDNYKYWWKITTIVTLVTMVTIQYFYS